MAEGGGGNDAKTNGDNPVIKSQMEVNECLSSWFAYLQMLNGLCCAGTKLAQSLQVLLSNHDAVLDCRLTGQCLAGWEELTRATGVASNTVRNHVIATLVDHAARDNDGDKHDILRDNLLTFINLQYQFCVACCECLGGIAECSCSQAGNTECDIATLQQCFERLYSSAAPVSASSIQQNYQRSPLRYPLFPVLVQRRWSETAAAEMPGESTDSTMRRWSMPWDCRHIIEWPRQEERSMLTVPQPDRSRSITPDSVWKSSGMASEDGLQEAIQLLSCRPGNVPSNQPSVLNSQHVPGVILTTCSFEANYTGSGWPDSRRGGSPRWPQDSHSSDHSDHSGHSGDHRDSEHSGASGSAGYRGSKDSIPSHSDHSSHRESDASTNIDLPPSRKNSSSAESCLSVNSRSGSESAATGEGARSPFYSMWTSGDLPFIKLPENSDRQDDRPPTN
ncbi:uncharacterized protein LOC135167303 [Diachasmimorpha longicaudata]|uniref:uncharacterized protein LOC135167303 n=1 Tax=Diachasmimorpha longicaudata TaxID=58733 RepID=UPI0030B89BCA